MSPQDLNSLTNEELYNRAKSYRDLLMKRKKTLRNAYDRAPQDISPYALNKLEEGIPLVSKKMGRATLKASLLRLSDLKNMTTATVRGAKKRQNEMLRTIANVPTTGRLNKQDQQKVNDLRDQVAAASRANRDLVSEFWQGYEHFKQNVAYKGYDTARTLNEYQNTYNAITASGTPSLDALRQAIEQYTTAQYEEEAEKNDIFGFGRQGGMFK